MSKKNKGLIEVLVFLVILATPLLIGHYFGLWVVGYICSGVIMWAFGNIHGQNTGLLFSVVFWPVSYPIALALITHALIGGES